jgi:rhamnogalacturonan endolyase
MFRMIVLLLLAVTTSAVAQSIAALPPAPVTLTQTDTAITLDNGNLSITLDKSGPRQGQLTSIKTRVRGKPFELGNNANAFMFDYDNHDKTVDKGHTNFGPGSTISIASQSPELADLSVKQPPSPNCPFTVDMHYLLRRGDSGFYTCMTMHHSADAPAVTFEQTRAVLRAARGSEPFTNYIVDDERKGPYPEPPALETVFDTTWRYKDAGIVTKYHWSKFIADDLVHGMAGKGKTNPLPNAIGLWLIAPSREYVNAGPLRQELTTHQDSPTTANQNNILLWMLAGNHFGGPHTTINAGQEWTHFYGPAFIYINQARTTDATWEDAKRRAGEEEKRWPYDFIHDPNYPLERGYLTGTLKLTSNDSPKDAWVVLAPAGEKDWCMGNAASAGYEFWAKADASGRFTIPHIRPGTWSLHASGANQFEDFFQDNIEVKKGTTDIGTITWQTKPTGKILFQLGTPDRSSQEFKNGHNERTFNNATNYAKDFHNDVTFTVGTSKESEDWNYAQFGIYVKQPYWALRFTLSDQPPTGATAKLTIAVAAFQPTTLDKNTPPSQIPPAGTGTLALKINGHDLPPARFEKSGMSFYRAGGQDSLRQIATIEFPASLLKPGQNERQLAIPGARQVKPGEEIMPNLAGGAMYDCIRLELVP